MKPFLIVSRLFFVVLMFLSAGGKLLDMVGFYNIVASYQILPPFLIPAAAWALTLLELFIGVVLMLPRTWRLATYTLPPIHVFYLLGLSAALLRGLALQNCGCFGVYWARPLTTYSIIEDVVLLSWACAFVWAAKRAGAVRA